MRQKEIKYFGDPQQGRLNSDDSPFALTANEWVNSENIRTGSTDKGFTGVLESVGGNVEVCDFPYISTQQLDWSAKNLDVETFRNGDPIERIDDPVQWALADYPAYCYYDNDDNYNENYGKLYNWYAVTDPRGLAPYGWQIPTRSQYDNLVNGLGTDPGGKAKDTGLLYWLPPNEGATNESGLTMRGGGYRDNNGGFVGGGEVARFWTSTNNDTTTAWYATVDYDTTDFLIDVEKKKNGFSVRIVRDPYRYLTIGTADDIEKRRILYFNFDDYGGGGDHINCLYTETGQIYRVLSSDQVSGGLNFDKYSLIHSAKVTDNILSWVDGTNNEPRKINIESGIKANQSGFVTDEVAYEFPLDFSQITMIKPPPIYCPNTEKKSDPSYINNFISSKSFEFAFQYEYYDNERSVIGSYSIASRLDIEDSVINYIEVQMDGNENIPSTVKKVYLIARLTDGSSTGGNSAFVANVWDKSNPNQEDEIINQNDGITPLTFNFYNNISGAQIAPDDVLRPYDSVPIYSQTHEIAKGRYFLGNNTDGYDTPTDSSLVVSIINSSTQTVSTRSFQLYKITIQSAAGGAITSGKQWALKGYFIFDGMNYWLVKTTNAYRYTTNGNTLPADPTPPPSTINATTGLARIGYSLFTIVNQLLPRTSNTTLANVPVLPTPSPTLSSDGTSYTIIRNIELIKPIVNVQVTNFPGSAYDVFAQQSPYKFGTVFYDYAMRKCGVVGNVNNDDWNQVYEYKTTALNPSQIGSTAPDLIFTPLVGLNVLQVGDKIEVSNTSTSLDNTYYVAALLRNPVNTLRITADSPPVATVPTITGTVIIKVYRRLRVEVTTPTAQGINGYVNNIRWELSNFNAASEIPDWAYYYSVVRTLNLRTRYFIQSKTYSAVYFKQRPDGSWDETNTSPTFVQGIAAIGLPIDNLLRNGLGYTYERELGDICILYAAATTGAISVNLPVIGQVGGYILVKPYDLGYFGSEAQGLNGMEIHYEVYHPYNPIDQEPYYEVGEIYPINNPTTAERQYSALSGNFRGDCAKITRDIANVSIGSSLTTFPIVAMCANDLYYERWDNDGGKVNVITEYGRTENPYAVRWSDAIISGSQINGTSTFRTNNIIYVPNTCGSITKLQLTSKIQNEGTVMLGLCKSEIASMYLGEQQIVDSTGATRFFGASDNVIGTINILRGNYGCANPESVFQYRGRVYFVDIVNGKVLQYSENGIDPISAIKMNRFWRNWSALYSSLSLEDIEYIDEFNSWWNRPYLFTVVDPYHDELLINTPTISLDPPKGYLPDYEGAVYPFDILDYQGKQIVYKIGMMSAMNPHWQGAYKFTTDYFATMGINVYSFRSGAPYLHNQDTQNTFYGDYSPSKVMFTSNSLPQVPKVYDNFLTESNLVPNFVYFYNENPYLQTSDLIDGSFVNLEGVWYANILRNKLIPSENDYDVNLLTGELMRNKNMYVLLQFSPTSTVLDLRIIQISYSISKGHIF
jgi:uncharacterized protein (TIGR02145 family)